MEKEFLILILILIKGQQVNLQLLKEGSEKFVDEIDWIEENNLSLKLLENIDKLLKRNKISLEQLNNIEVDSDEKTYSSTRIARTVAEAGRYCLTN